MCWIYALLSAFFAAPTAIFAKGCWQCKFKPGYNDPYSYCFICNMGNGVGKGEAKQFGSVSKHSLLFPDLLQASPGYFILKYCKQEKCPGWHLLIS